MGVLISKAAAKFAGDSHRGWRNGSHFRLPHGLGVSAMHECAKPPASVPLTGVASERARLGEKATIESMVKSFSRLPAEHTLGLSISTLPGEPSNCKLGLEVHDGEFAPTRPVVRPKTMSDGGLGESLDDLSASEPALQIAARCAEAEATAMACDSCDVVAFLPSTPSPLRAIRTRLCKILFDLSTPRSGASMRCKCSGASPTINAAAEAAIDGASKCPVRALRTPPRIQLLPPLLPFPAPCALS